jgi:predicted  nucleic acid-binding Zn-ribbon protein
MTVSIEKQDLADIVQALSDCHADLGHTAMTIDDMENELADLKADVLKESRRLDSVIEHMQRSYGNLLPDSDGIPF